MVSQLDRVERPLRHELSCLFQRQISRGDIGIDVGTLIPHFEVGPIFADADIYSELYVVDVMQKTLDNRRADLKAFLQGLYDAQFYIKDHPDESKKVLIKYTKLDREIVDDIWDNFVFKPAINQLFIDYTTAEAKWAIEKGTFPSSTPVPDFKAVLYPDLLRNIDAKAVALN